MNIFNENPKNWLDLQNKVAYVLNSCGYTVETPNKIRTARERWRLMFTQVILTNEKSIIQTSRS